MIKFMAPYVIHAICVVLLIFKLIPLVGSDVYIYAYSMIGAIVFTLINNRNFKERIFQFFAFQSITLWICYYYLPNNFRYLTQHLVEFRELLLILLVLIELSIAYVLIKNYKVHRTKGSSGGEAFEKALSKIGIPAGLTKIFVVEWNIWGNLFKRIFLKAPIKDSQGVCISTGYSKKVTFTVFALLCGCFLLCLSLLPGLWKAIAGLACFYLVILFHGDIVGFYIPISSKKGSINIPNGIFGSIFLEQENIKRITSGELSDKTLKVGRLIEPSLLIELHRPIEYFGETFESVAIPIAEPDLKKALSQ